jgi:hypothetical protein
MMNFLQQRSFSVANILMQNDPQSSPVEFEVMAKIMTGAGEKPAPSRGFASNLQESRPPSRAVTLRPFKPKHATISHVQ